MEPPACIQNAMLTKDKKPFTYTPGGLNLAEIRSPRMARRIERNAAYEGVATSPQQPSRQPIPQESLPPSVVAAMQPQMHVQVFPSGPPPAPPMNQMRNGVPPPPPPPPSGVPPPPLTPMRPLPTQKIRTTDEGMVERPDMTKIIPENPMALLKKTGGPRIRSTLLDEVYREPNRNHQEQQPTHHYVNPQISAQSSMQQPWSPPTQNPSYQQQQNIQVQRSPPVQQQNICSPPIIERSNPPQQTHSAQQQPSKTVNLGSIYIPPLTNQHAVNSVPSPPGPQTPGTPILKEAPKPWQQKQQQKQETIPEWAKKEQNVSASPVVLDQQVPQQQQPRWPQINQATPQLQSQVPYGNQQQSQIYESPHRRIDQPHKYKQPQEYPDPSSRPNAVFVTQPIVLQHPGGGYGPPIIDRRENVNVTKLEGGSTIIPIQLEGTEPSNSNRSLNRQQSWSNNPTQSGSFRVIQKLTGTEGDEGGFEPRLRQQIPQEQMRKMQPNSGDQELMNRFKQDVDSEKFLHGQSSDPRYMGAEIPSKAFRLLQNMTEQPKGPTHVPNDAGRNKPQVRTIPIQIEGGGASPVQSYVPPSQQIPAQEPKKYTGSSIPSRSFKMLQAMTAPDSCANAKEANETNDYNDSLYNGENWPYQPAYPMYPPTPFWPPFYPPNPHEHPSTEHSNSDPELSKTRKTPLPFWGYAQTTPTADSEQKYSASRKTPSSFSRCSSTSELEHINSRKTPFHWWGYPTPGTPTPGRKTPKSNTESENDSSRNTPIPFWPGYPHHDNQDLSESNKEASYQYYPPYPPYYDPYYFSYYYYGYPPLYSPVPFAYQNSESDDVNGYSSMDEMSYYNQKLTKPSTLTANLETPTPTVEILVTPSSSNENGLTEESERELNTSDSDTDTEVNEKVPKRNSSVGGLQTIRSVKDINVYQHSEDEAERSEGESDSDASSNSSVYETEHGEEIIPHQLSVIFEVSERTDFSRNGRECSVVSDCTTVGAKSDEDEEDVHKNKHWISDNLMEIASRIQSRIDARIGLDDSEEKLTFTKENNMKNLEEVNSINNCQKWEEIPEESICLNNMPEASNGLRCCFEELGRHQEKSKFCDSELSSENEEFINNCHDKETCELVTEEVMEKHNFEDETQTNIESCKISEESEVVSKESSDSEDWWGLIGNKEDDFPVRKPYSYKKDSLEYTLDKEQIETEESIDYQKPESCDSINTEIISSDEVLFEETSQNLVCSTAIDEHSNNLSDEQEEETNPKLENTSAHSSHSSASSRKVSNAELESEESSSESDEEEDKEKHDINNNEHKCEVEEEAEMPSIKDRIRALQESIVAKKKSLTLHTEEMRVRVKAQVASIDGGEPANSRTVSEKGSVKSFDEISEEDSGVTDMSRQFSDNEEFPELRKMSRYQRASTHSRLFELLQGECDGEEDIDMEERKSQMTLPLNTTVNDKLAEELVQSMLMQKKGQIFRNMSVDKLHAAAKKILQEESNSADTPSDGFSEFLSPLKTDTGNSTPQEFYGHYNDYMQYYDSWAQAAALQENYNTIPAKTFKSIQDSNRSSAFSISLAKCPRVLSGKNVHSDLKKLVECPEEAPPLPTGIPHTKS